MPERPNRQGPGLLGRALGGGALAVAGLFLANECVEKDNDVHRTLSGVHDRANSQDGGEPEDFDTGEKGAEEGNGRRSGNDGADELAVEADEYADWGNDPDWVGAGNELAAALSYAKEHLSQLQDQLDGLEEGDPLPNWVNHAHCTPMVITLSSNYAVDSREEAEAKGLEEEYWKFEYLETPAVYGPEVDNDRKNYIVNFDLPEDSDIGADIDANLADMGSNSTPDGEVCESGTEAVLFDVETDFYADDEESRFAGDFCAPSAEEVAETVGLHELEQQARAICDRVDELR